MDDGTVGVRETLNVDSMQPSTTGEGGSSDPQSERKRGRTKALFKGSALAADDVTRQRYQVDATHDG